MKVFFRVDASIQMGTGHVMRCLTLAQVLKENGADTGFICRKHEGNLIDKIHSSGFNVHELEVIEELEVDNKLAHSHWLGATQQQDADDCIGILKKEKIDWLIVDHYAIDEDWQCKLKPYYEKLMVIDDIADRRHECDLLLDQNLFDDMPARYYNKTPVQSQNFFGPQYALLQKEYENLHEEIQAKAQTIENILLFFSNMDLDGLTSKTLSALTQVDDVFQNVDVVISKQSPHYVKVKSQVEELPNAQLHSDLPSLVSLMAKADLAIGAGGTTHWERLCLALPSLVIILAENQRPVSRSLQKMGLIELIGEADTITADIIASSIKKVLLRSDINNWSNLCRAQCSGGGTSFIVDKLLNYVKL